MTTPNIDETVPTPIDRGAGNAPGQDEDNQSAQQPERDTDSLSINEQTTLPVTIDPDFPTQKIDGLPTANPPANSLETTQPSQIHGQGGEGGGLSDGEESRFPWKWLAVLALATLVIIAGMSAFGGYRAGLNQRNLSGTQAASSLITEQYQLGLKDMEAKHWDLARQRLEWVIQQDPNFPGVTDKLAAVLLAQNTIATPTTAPSPTPTSTPDTRSQDELYTQALQLMAGNNWSNAIDALLRLRKIEPTFHTVEIDGMLYVALRNRGVEKIKAADLEGGTYDLSLAERFGPLDVEAKNWRDWAELYIAGASFWEVDWVQAINYFKQLANAAPGITDSSGLTALERYKRALIGYGDQLLQNGKPCDAQAQYDLALQVGPYPLVEPTATYAADRCERSKPKPPTPVPTGTTTTGTPEVSPTSGAAETPTPTQEIPPTPTTALATPTPTQPGPPTATHTPAPSPTETHSPYTSP